MTIEFPYKVEINTKEEAYEFIKSLCINCPRYVSNWKCSAYTADKCNKARDLVVKEFKEQNMK